MPNIPDFPEFRPVCLTDREYLEGLLRVLQPELSELTYTNLFMFRHVHDYQLSAMDGGVAILAYSYSGKPYFMPPIDCRDPKKAVDSFFDYLRGMGDEPVIELASQGFVDEHIAGRPGYTFSADRDNADYVYNTSDLITLAGRKFHDKKNLLNRFLKAYPGHEYRWLTPDLLPQAKDLVERWCQEKCSIEIPSTLGETEATLLALSHMDRLGYTGGAVLIDGKVEAISLGEELNRETVVVHVEKANAEFAGLYQYISGEFLRREFPDHRFVNREQDLGEPNLRKSKLSYNPVRMVEKYTIKPA